jgi:hypothetical protein
MLSLHRDFGNLEADGSDVIKLNVGGVKIVARRAIKSKLASLFSGRFDKKLLHDKNDNIFLDVNPDCFKIILNYLSSCITSPDDSPPPLPEVSQELKPTFERLCAFFELFSEPKLSIESGELIRDVN